MIRAFAARHVWFGSAAWVVAPVAAALALLAIRLHADEWQYEYGWASENWATIVIVMAPLFGGAAAWDTTAALRSGRENWLASGDRGASALRQATAPSLIIAAVMLVVTWAYVVLRCRSHGAYGMPPWQSPVLAMTAMVTAVLLGSLAGRVKPHPLTSAAVAATWWGLAVAGSAAGPWAGVYAFSGATVSLSRLTYLDGAVVERIAGTSLLAALAVVALTPWQLRSWSWRRIAALTTTTLLCMLATITGAYAHQDLLTVDTSAREKVACAGAAPVICLHRVHEYRRDEVQNELAMVAGAMEALDPRLAISRFEEDVPGAVESVDSGQVSVALDVEPAVGDLAASSLISERCLSRYASSVGEEDFQHILASRWLTTTWIWLQVAPERVDVSDREALDAVLAQPNGVAWLSETLLVFRRCDLSSLPDLPLT